MVHANEAEALLNECFGSGSSTTLSVPGRVNLIGEHIDYHNLPVLPMAIQRRITIAFRPGGDRRIRAASAGLEQREFEWTARLEPSPPGDWVNYVKAAGQAVRGRWGLERGIDAAVVSDLPPAAGLSSSSALLVSFTLALLQANGVHATFEELMEVLPEGEHFVGTRGGGMDHAAVLASRAGCALLVGFAPVSATPVPIPSDWSFLVAHSMTTAEKSGAVRAEYNSRRTAGNAALHRLGLQSYAEAIGHDGSGLIGEELDSFVHVTGEALRVRQAVSALRNGDRDGFGRLLNESHHSLRDRLRVSNQALDTVVNLAREGGALGARLTGAGFGGFVVILCTPSDRGRIREELMARYYSQQSGFDPAKHLIDVEASAGALFA